MAKRRKAKNRVKYPKAGSGRQMTLHQGGNTSKTSTSKGNGYGYKSCYHDHPVVKLGNGTFVGGNCGSPVTKDADVYVGLDDFSFRRLYHRYPWETPDREVVEFEFRIPDMQAPPSLKDFRNLVDYLSTALDEGKTVHVGCIGGHGRTGTVLAALVKQITGEEDAIEWVRKHYCKKAVETESQIQFLNKNYGIKVTTASKTYGGFAGVAGMHGKTAKGTSSYDDFDYDYEYGKPKVTGPSSSRIIRHVRSKACIWG